MQKVLDKIIIRNSVLFSIALISLVMHFNHFSKDLRSIHVWRQTQTQSTIINFYEEDMNIFNPRRNERGNGDGIFRMEFPLMQWTVAVLYKIFGNHLFISRLFMFIIGLLSVLGMYKLLFAVFRNYTLALVGAWTFNFSPSFYYHTINPLPDNLALCFSIWGVAMFFNWLKNKKAFFLIFCGILLSLGALCKLPFILYMIVPVSYFILEIRKYGIKKEFIYHFSMVSVFSILPLAWYIKVIPQWHGNGIVQGALSNHVSFITVLDFLQHNLVSTLPELLLNYGSLPFFIFGFYSIYKNKSYAHPLFPVFVSWSIAILAYFLFELNMIAKIHDYYLFPFYPLLFIIVGYGAYNLLISKRKSLRYLTLLLVLTVPLLAYLRIQYRWNDPSTGFNKDLLTYKTELQKAVPDDALCIAGNDESHFIFFYYINKKGWGFDKDSLSAESLKTMIDNGASYLYSDSRSVDSGRHIIPLIDKLVLQKGTIKVYTLKKQNL